MPDPLVYSAGMSSKHAILAEFDHEMAVTRRLLERLPDQDFDWTPHPKSFTLGGLATHLAQLPHWGQTILVEPAYDLTAGSSARAVSCANRDEVLSRFDTHVSEVRNRLVHISNAELAAPWELRRSNQVLMSVPRLAALRSFVINHAVHHRGQLTVYLRMRDVPLPPIYGPTADEGM